MANLADASGHPNFSWVPLQLLVPMGLCGVAPKSVELRTAWECPILRVVRCVSISMFLARSHGAGLVCLCHMVLAATVAGSVAHIEVHVHLSNAM